MNPLALTNTIKWVSIGLFVLGVFAGTFLVGVDPEGLPQRYWARYVAHLERKLRSMFNYTKGAHIAWAQTAGVFLCLLVWALFDVPFWYVAIILILIGPAYVIEAQRKKRVLDIELQIDGFVLALANALKATPSLGDGFRSVQLILRDPLRQEVEVAVKEMRLGSTLDQALLLMASRIGSRQLDSALSAILIGRQVGGNLPKILETTAATLREMQRLEGVVRTKTAEGKMQMWVLAIMPFVLMLMLNWVQPGYFDVLTESFGGYVVAILAAGFWGASLVVARKILSVDV